MINPSTIDIDSLPSVALAERSQLPNTSGIYIAATEDGSVQYVGQARNLNQRWSTHNYLHHLRKLSNVRVFFLLAPVSTLDELETTLIEVLQPPLNKLNVGRRRKSNGVRIRQIREVEVGGLGERIKKARLAIANIKSLEQICEEVGVSRTYWYDVEKETLKGALSIENLRKIEEVLGVSFGVNMEGDRND